MAEFIQHYFGRAGKGAGLFLPLWDGQQCGLSSWRFPPQRWLYSTDHVSHWKSSSCPSQSLHSYFRNITNAVLEYQQAVRCYCASEHFGQKLLLKAWCCRAALFPLDVPPRNFQTSMVRLRRHDFLNLCNSSLPELGIQTKSHDSLSMFVLWGTTSCCWKIDIDRSVFLGPCLVSVALFLSDAHLLALIAVWGR